MNACYAASLSLWRAADSIGRALHAHMCTGSHAPMEPANSDGSPVVRCSVNLYFHPYACSTSSESREVLNR